MFCKNCGKEIDDKAVVCVHCGVAVAPLTPTVTPDSASKKFNVCALLGFIFAILGILIDTVMLFSGYTLLHAFTIAGLVLSIIGTVKSKKLQNGKGFGIAGIIISSVSILLGIILVVAVFGIVWFMLILSLISGIA